MSPATREVDVRVRPVLDLRRRPTIMEEMQHRRRDRRLLAAMVDGDRVRLVGVRPEDGAAGKQVWVQVEDGSTGDRVACSLTDLEAACRALREQEAA